MKIGIVTFHFADNYGALLQAYSMQEFLRSRGHDAFFIDYVPPNKRLWRIAADRFRLWLSGLVGRRGAQKFPTEIDSPFKKFRNSRLNLSRRCRQNHDARKLGYECDLIIVGSDQVWNTNLNYHSISYFLLDSFDYLRTPLMSYAACIGTSAQRPGYHQFFARFLSRFSFIGVRNDFTLRYVEGCGVSGATVVCDPTLLVDQRTLLNLARQYHEEYILVYVLSPEHKDLAIKTLSDTLNVNGRKIIWVTGRRSIIADGDWDFINNASPEEWLSLIAGASLLLTDSFHGMIFSIKFGVPFIPIQGGGWRSERIDDALKRYGLINSKGVHQPNCPNVKKLIREDVARSSKYIEDALDEIKKRNLC